MSKKIWIISELYYPEETSTGYILTKIAEGLAEEHSVHVICGQSDYTGTLVKARSVEEYNGVSIERCSIPRLNKNKLLPRIIRMILLSLLMSFKAVMKIERGDRVIVATNPPSLLFFIAIICKIRGAKLFLLVHDIFPENLVVAGLTDPDSSFFQLLKSVSVWMYKHAFRIIVIGRDMKKIINNKIGTNDNRVIFIPNWADSEEIRPLPREKSKFLSDIGLENKFVVQFAGNLGRVQGIENVLSAADKLQEDDVHFLFIGNGANKQLIKDTIDSGRLKNVTLFDHKKRDEQENFLNACDIALISLAPNMFGLGVPSKTYNIMAAGKPIIAVVDPESEVGLLVEEEKIGWVVPPSNPKKLVQAILQARIEHKLLQEMGNRARHMAETKYSRVHIINSYKSLFREG